MIDVIYLCAGVGKRANLGYPKQFLSLHGKPLLIHGLETLRRIKEIGEIIIPCPEEDRQKILKACFNYNIDHVIVCQGGDTRQDSSYLGLSEVVTEEVLICEAVRPFMSLNLIKKVLDCENEFVVPISQMYASVIDCCGNSFDRNTIGPVQMPQKYNTQLLNHGHVKARVNEKFDYTDDAALIINELGLIPKIVKGEDVNIKITTPLDVYIAEAIYKYLQGEKQE